MSRNRGTIECQCGFWKFQDVRELSIFDSTLMTEDQYFRAINWENCPYKQKPGGDFIGHGYREREDDWWWDSPDGRGSTNSRSAAGPDWTPRVYRYQSVPYERRFRWRKLECPICHRFYVGWYVRQPHQIEPRVEDPKYELYDTSFYRAFNDEPCKEDEDALVEWTPQDIASLFNHGSVETYAKLLAGLKQPALEALAVALDQAFQLQNSDS